MTSSSNQSHDGHHHSALTDYAQANREYFDKIAHAYDEKPHIVEVVASIAHGFLKEYDFNEEATRVLDFACGTGLLSRELAPHSKQIIGVDISQGMVDQYNLRVANQGIAPEEMRAVRAELKGEAGELDGHKFDVVVCSMAYHHFEDIEGITRKLAFFIKPGGVLLVADLIKGASQSLMGHNHQDALRKHVIPHAGGFDEAALRPAFEKASLEGFTFTPRVHIQKGEKEMNVFVAKGVKPQASTAA